MKLEELKEIAEFIQKQIKVDIQLYDSRRVKGDNVK